MAEIKLDTYRKLDYPGLMHRRVDVWLPPKYHDGDETRFPVLYMQDGQNLFHPRFSIGFGWQVAETITDLAERERITPPIVVGITSTANRVGDYMPQKPFEKHWAEAAAREELSRLSAGDEKPIGDLYLRWMVEILKPFIDRTYRTLPEKEHTAVMGSSMGALISLYALCEYPQSFGMAACLSTHWPIVGQAMLDYCRETLPPAGTHRLYFDHGTLDLDSQYGPWQEKMNALMLEKGYTEGKDWESWVFPGDGHRENYWAHRLHIPLTFLFGTELENSHY